MELASGKRNLHLERALEEHFLDFVSSQLLAMEDS